MFPNNSLRLTGESQILDQCDREVESKPEKRCVYEVIPRNPKFVYPDEFFLFYCDIPLFIQNGQISTEFCLFNYFKNIKDITIQNDVKKMINISMENNFGVQAPTWRDQLKKMEQLSNGELPEVDKWCDLLKNFCEKFELFRLAGMSFITNPSQDLKEKFEKINKESIMKRRKILQQYPVLGSKVYLRNNNFQCENVFLTESFLKEIGYTIENFTSTCFEDGLPQMTPFDKHSQANLIAIEMLINNFFSFENKTNIKSNEVDAICLMKSGYHRKMKVQIHLLMTYENNTLGYELLFPVTKVQKPTLNKNVLPNYPLNTLFLEDKAEEEKLKSEFFGEFYRQEPLEFRYTHYQNVCGIKEIKKN